MHALHCNCIAKIIIDNNKQVSKREIFTFTLNFSWSQNSSDMWSPGHY